MEKPNKLTNKERLEKFKGYVYGNKNRISYKTYVMFNHTCNNLLETFLNYRQPEILLDLKEHVMFLIQIYKFIKQNYPQEENLPKIKERFHYFKDWIESESDIVLKNNKE